MSFIIYPSSEKVLSKVISKESELPVLENAGDKRHKYPFQQLQIGESFAIPCDLAREQSLRICAVNAAAKFEGKKFCVLRHKDANVFEVGRIA